MIINGEVISAFLDDEAFEPRALAEALAHPDGRDLLIDLVLLRHLAQSADLPERHGNASRASETAAVCGGGGRGGCDRRAPRGLPPGSAAIDG
jgi:hypothetical protein